MEQFINFIDVDVDGCGTDVTVPVRVVGEKSLTQEIVEKINTAIRDYKEENEGEWDTDGCIDVAFEVLEKEGYKVEIINPTIEIAF